MTHPHGTQLGVSQFPSLVGLLLTHMTRTLYNVSGKLSTFI